MGQLYDLVVFPYGSFMLQYICSVKEKDGFLELVNRISLPEMVCGNLHKSLCKHHILAHDHINFFLRGWIAGRLVKALGGR